jgi:hypothetical protein
MQEHVWAAPFSSLQDVICPSVSWKQHKLVLSVESVKMTGKSHRYRVPDTVIEIDDGPEWKTLASWNVTFEHVLAFRVTAQDGDDALGIGLKTRKASNASQPGTSRHRKTRWLKEFEFAVEIQGHWKDAWHYVMHFQDIGFVEIIALDEPAIIEQGVEM